MSNTRIPHEFIESVILEIIKNWIVIVKVQLQNPKYDDEELSKIFINNLKSHGYKILKQY